ncbi:MAG: NTP transferase domain-containing protein, partial [Chloroflexota bacterium]
GDEPRLTLEQVQVVLGAAEDPTRPIVVPRYGGVPGNPALLERAAWPLAVELSGDAGMSQLFRSRPELVRHVDVPGVNPDIDTPADLAALRSRP